MTSPCDACHQGCCHTYVVTVNGYDAWVIASGLGLTPAQFLVPVAQRTADERGFLLDGSGWTFDLALDKAPATTTDKPCIFWKTVPTGVGRCGIYQYRPLVCQIYPATARDGQVELRDDALCPRGAWRDGTFRRPGWRERLQRLQVEADIYALAVSRWNDHFLRAIYPAGAPVADYFDYVMAFYARLEPVRAAHDAAGGPAMWPLPVDAIRAVADGFFRDDPPLAELEPDDGRALLRDVVGAGSRVAV